MIEDSNKLYFFFVDGEPMNRWREVDEKKINDGSIKDIILNEIYAKERRSKHQNIKYKVVCLDVEELMTFGIGLVNE